MRTKLGTWRAGPDVRPCTHADGDLTAASFIGASRHTDEAPSLVMWNCACGSTLATTTQEVLHDGAS